MRRLVMIGLDNASWSLIERFVADGTMPRVGALARSGLRGDVESPGAFVAEARWPEFATGRTPTEMQYWSMMEFDPVDYSSWYGRVSQAPYFWARPDLVSIVFDVPETGLSEDGRGLHVVGWGSHAQGHPPCSRPHQLLAEIDERFGVHPMTLTDSHNGWHNDRYVRTLCDSMIEGIDRRVEVSRWLMEKRPDWQLFLTVFGEPHALGHQLMHTFDPEHPLATVVDPPVEQVREVLTRLDAAVGRLIDGLDDDDAVMLFVTHGMRPNGTDTVGGILLPEILHRKHFGEPLVDIPDYSHDAAPVVPDQEILPRHLVESRLTRRAPTFEKGATGLAKRSARVVRSRLSPAGLARFEKLAWRRPDWWERRDRPASPRTSIDVLAEARRRSADQFTTSWYRAFWKDMPYFVVPSFSDVHLRINLEGRERFGSVPADAYDDLVERVTEQMLALRDPRTGRPVVREVLRVRENPFHEPGPPSDLVLKLSDVVTDSLEDPEIGPIGPVPFQRLGEHDVYGWFALHDGETDGELPGPIRPKDLAATAIDVLGLADDPRITGRSARSLVHS